MLFEANSNNGVAWLAKVDNLLNLLKIMQSNNDLNA
jgi:hypothetical protein